MIGEDKANMARHPDVALDRPISDRQLAELRGRLSQISVTAVQEFYHAAWIRCGLERNASWPRAKAFRSWCKRGKKCGARAIEGEKRKMRTIFLIAAMTGPKYFRRFCLYLVLAAAFLFYCVSR
jgi:hypothetical protein